jgi:hypothetical protein
LTAPDPAAATSFIDIERSPAVQLFLDRASAAQPRFVLKDENARAIAHISRRLDGIPLALELAAACLEALSVQGFGTRIDQRFRLLTMGNRAALPPPADPTAAIAAVCSTYHEALARMADAERTPLAQANAQRQHGLPGAGRAGGISPKLADSRIRHAVPVDGPADSEVRDLDGGPASDRRQASEWQSASTGWLKSLERRIQAIVATVLAQLRRDFVRLHECSVARTDYPYA